jgi:hypothetical protein
MMRNTIPAILMILAGLNMARAADSAATQPALDAQHAPELDAKVPADFVEHVAGDTGVTIRSPKEWTEGKLRSANVKLNLLADPSGRGVNLVVVPAAPSQTVELTVQLVPIGLRKQFPGLKQINADIVKINGDAVGRIVYEATISNIDLRFCQFFFLKNQKQYILTYTARAEQYDQLLPVAEQVAASMKLP